MKTADDLAHERILEEDIAKDQARYLSVMFKDILKYLEEHHPAKAEKPKEIDEKINFRQLRNKDFRLMPDRELYEFTKLAGEYIKLFRSVDLESLDRQIAEGKLQVIYEDEL